ncbi:MAG: YitT family protein [Alistipes sp.]|nr:YitT family protein [Alistipes sp.]
MAAISLNKKSFLTTTKEYILMTLGMALYSFGWICCILPANAAGGGATGLSLLIYHLTGGVISIGTMVLIINAILLVIAGFIVGWKFGIKTIYCVVIMSVIMHFLQEWFTIGDPNGWVAEIITKRDSLTLPNGTIVDLFNLKNRLLSAILGGICSGVGVAMCFQQGGSTGGSDIVVMIVNKFYSISYGKFIRYTDSLIISAALFIPDVGIDGVIYGFVMVAVFSYTVDMILSGNQQSSQIFIICKDYRAMADAINNEAYRGATVIDSVGWYTKNESKIVMVVCRKRDLSMVLKVVKKVDPEAFITIGSVMGVYGKGFDALNKI